MNVKSKIAINTSSQIVTLVVAAITGLISVGILTRHLGPDGYGKYVTIFAFMQLFSLISNLGLPQTMVRFITSEKWDEAEAASNILSLRLLLSLILAIASPLFALLFPYDSVMVIAIAVAGIQMICSSARGTINIILFKYLTSWKATVVDVIGYVLVVTGISILAKHEGGVLEIVIWMVSVSALQLIITFFLARQHTKLKLGFKLSLWRLAISDAWPFAINSFLLAINRKGGILVLSFFYPHSQAGLLGISNKVVNTANVLPGAFQQQMQPLVSTNYSQKNTEGLIHKLRISANFTALLVFPLFAGAIVVARDIAILIGGINFSAAGTIITILLLKATFFTFGNPVSMAVIAMGLQRKFVKISIVQTITTIVLLFIIVPFYGALGVAIAILLSGNILAVAKYRVVSKIIPLKWDFRSLAAIALSAALMAIFVYFIPTHIHVLLRVLAGAIIYSIIVLVTGGVSINLIKEVLGRKNS